MQSYTRTFSPIIIVIFSPTLPQALPARNSFTGHERQGTRLVSEKETVDLVCEDIKRAVLDDQKESIAFIEDQEIVSIEDAKRSTGLIEQWSHSLKKMVWA